MTVSLTRLSHLSAAALTEGAGGVTPPRRGRATFRIVHARSSRPAKCGLESHSSGRP